MANSKYAAYAALAQGVQQLARQYNATIILPSSPLSDAMLTIPNTTDTITLGLLRRRSMLVVGSATSNTYHKVSEACRDLYGEPHMLQLFDRELNQGTPQLLNLLALFLKNEDNLLLVEGLSNVKPEVLHQLYPVFYASEAVLVFVEHAYVQGASQKLDRAFIDRLNLIDDADSDADVATNV